MKRLESCKLRGTHASVHSRPTGLLLVLRRMRPVCHSTSAFLRECGWPIPFTQVSAKSHCSERPALSTLPTALPCLLTR